MIDLARLLEVIEPFAKEARFYDPAEQDGAIIDNEHQVWGDCELTVGQLRAARDAHASITGGESSSPSRLIEDRAMPWISELPENIRIPLHSLKADLGYLFGRAADDPAVKSLMIDSAADRLSQIETACLVLVNYQQPADFHTRDKDALYLRIRELETALQSIMGIPIPQHKIGVDVAAMTKIASDATKTVHIATIPIKLTRE